MIRIKLLGVMALVLGAGAGYASVPLDSCRSMALRHNKEILIANQKIEAAKYQKDQAKAAYLPSIDFVGSYMYNQKNISLIEEDALLPTKSFNPSTGGYDYNLLIDPSTGKPMMVNGQVIPSQVALLPKEALTYDIHNVFAGALTLTQPVYMGGKIKAMNDITRYAEALASTMRNKAVEDVVYQVDAAYWQVVSLKAKERLARSYVNLLDTLNHNVEAMVREGVATKADALSVAVKLNEANVDMTKVTNGLALSRMLLSQLCGLPVNTTFTLADEDSEHIGEQPLVATSYNMDDVYARRHDINALQLGVKIYEKKAKVAMSDMLPQVALMGMYSVTNPNSFNGFKNKFGGAFSVGATLKIPLWHWGGNYNKYRAAKTEAVIQNLELENARDKIALQVNQASFKAQEAIKTYESTRSNLAKAEENLRMAQIGFKEGVMPIDNVMAAQTAWLKAYSEVIDAQIDVQLCNVYLSKVLGTMQY
ncbi:MAG: TolC family protein [Muribaculaceae bacterium]